MMIQKLLLMHIILERLIKPPPNNLDIQILQYTSVKHSALTSLPFSGCLSKCPPRLGHVILREMTTIPAQSCDRVAQSYMKLLLLVIAT